MKMGAVIGALLVLASVAPMAQAKTEQKTLAWIKSSNPYGNYLEAAVEKKHVPVEFTTRKKNAKLLVTLTAQERKGSTWRAVLTGNSGRASALSMSVANAKTGVIVFSYTCHKGGHGFLRTGHSGFQSAAECLAKHWAKEMK